MVTLYKIFLTLPKIVTIVQQCCLQIVISHQHSKQVPSFCAELKRTAHDWKFDSVYV